MIGLLSKLLSRFQPIYLQRVEFSAHIGWSLSFLFIGVLLYHGDSSILRSYLGHLINIAWFLYTLYDEFFVDGWKGKDKGWDSLWDLGSKLCGQLGYLIYVVV